MKGKVKLLYLLSLDYETFLYYLESSNFHGSLPGRGGQESTKNKDFSQELRSLSNIFELIREKPCSSNVPLANNTIHIPLKT